MTYVELHSHSAYSFLDGASQPEELAARAAELGYTALALTDHDGVYGSLEFAHAAKHFGVRAITGAEVTLADDSHVTLLVETAQGYANLCRPLPGAHGTTRLRGGGDEPLPPKLEQSLLEHLNDGLVCLSGCARNGLALRNPNAAACLARAFGRDRFFIELQRPYERGDRRRRTILRDLAETLGVRTIATGDAHAHHPRRGPLWDVLELARECAHEVRGRSAARNVLPPGRGRGSSVGSLVCYLTGLSHVDPVEGDLSLGRFLNRDLAGVPDIDLDFPRDIREKLIVAVTERYGRDHAALVASFATYRSRGAIRDVGKALGLPYAELERIARVSEGDRKSTRLNSSHLVISYA